MREKIKYIGLLSIVILILLQFGCNSKLNTAPLSKWYSNRYRLAHLDSSGLELFVADGVPIHGKGQKNLTYFFHGKPIKEQVFSDNGKLTFEFYYNNNFDFAGPIYEYFNNGSLKWSAYIINGKFNGLYTEYDKKGEIIHMYEYENDSIVKNIYSIKEFVLNNKNCVPFSLIILNK
jgi:hypothetical protein